MQPDWEPTPFVEAGWQIYLLLDRNSFRLMASFFISPNRVKNDNVSDVGNVYCFEVRTDFQEKYLKKSVWMKKK